MKAAMSSEEELVEHREERAWGTASGATVVALRRLERQQAVLVRLGACALEAAGTEALAEALAREAAVALDAAGVEVRELTPDGQALVVRAAEGALAQTVGSALALEPGSPERRALDACAPAERRPRDEGEPRLGSSVCVAVGPAQARWGVVIAHARHRRPFLPPEIDFLTSLAHLLGGALERERLAELSRRPGHGELLSRVAGAVAHDLNNVLGAIGTSASTVGSLLPQDRELAQDLALIEQAVRRGGRIARRLLAFAGKRLEAARPTPLNEAVREAQGLLERILHGEPRIEAVVPREPLYVHMAPDDLEPLVVGLALAACEMAPREGAVRLTVEAAAGGGAALTISGAGAAMDIGHLLPTLERAGGRLASAGAPPGTVTILLPGDDRAGA